MGRGNYGVYSGTTIEALPVIVCRVVIVPVLAIVRGVIISVNE
jgi:hypothetical protein